MALFAYKAINTSGQRVRGRLAAANLLDLEQRLTRMGLDFITGSPATPGRWPWAGGHKVSRRQLIHFCFHLEQLLSAGVPLLEALVDLRDSSERAGLREIIADLIEAIEGGRNFSQALAAHPQVFTGVFSGLVRAGESAGRLPAVLMSLAESLKWQDELAAYARRLLIYPLMVAGVILAALVVSLTQVVPELARLLRSGGQALPLNTKILIALSDFVTQHGVALMMGLALLVIGLYVGLRFSPALRYRVDVWKLSLPVVGPILKKIIISRFAGLMAMMYASGIAILEAVKNCEDAAGNTVIRRGLRQAAEAIGQGQNLTTAFQQTGLFPPLVIRMLKLGETTGGLDRALANVGYFYTRDVKESVERAQALMEPLLTLVLGGLLAWVMLSVLGPIYDVMTRLRF